MIVIFRAGRVSAVLLGEPEFGAQPAAPGRGRLRWWQPVAGGAVAAGVAAASILWLRNQAPPEGGALTAQVPQPVTTRVLNPQTLSPDSYVTPAAPATRAVVVPSTELANYVVAHSMFSSPVARRNLLSAFMTSEPASVEDPPEIKSDAKVNVQ